ncbi:hypothetical protein AYM17_05595 [Coxiella burnetii]|nr:hypothetical membrane spanning protein [Coxiella burnetii CbuG_Q212]ATN66867.1 hypothetical protein AYM17_05595 [Coxiella burnetii]OYK86190.1 lysylphosphatidylglycerol synthetase family protein [Coxiella burnetii]
MREGSEWISRMIRRCYKHYRFWTAVGFNGILFYLFYVWLQRTVPLHHLIVDMEHIHLGSALCVFPFYIFILLLYGLRLSFLMKIPFWKAFCVTSMGCGLNNILPFRLGDILRIYFAKQFFNLGISTTTAATLMERYFDLIMLLILGSLVLFSTQYALEVNVIYLFLILLSCSLLVIFYRYFVIKNGYLRNFITRSERARSLLMAIEEAVSRRNKVQVLGLSVAIWLSLFSLYYLFFSLNLPSAHLSPNQAVCLLFMTTLSFGIPYSLGGIGIHETAIVYYLIKYLHVLPTKALALALIFHAATAIPQIILMISIFLAFQFPRFRSLRPLLVLARQPSESGGPEDEHYP